MPFKPIKSNRDTIKKVKELNYISIGVFANKAIISIALFLIAKYFGSEVFGEYAYYQSILAALYPFAILGMENFLLIEKTRTDTVNSFIFNHCIFIGAILLVYYTTQSGSLNWILLLIPFNLALMALFDVLISNLIVKKHFIRNIQISLFFSVFTLFLQAVFFFLFERDVFYIIVAGLISYLLPLSYYALKPEVGGIVFCISLKNYKNFFLKNYRYILHYLLLTSADSFLLFIPVYFVKKSFSLEDVGTYFLCTKIFTFPITIIGVSLSRYFLVEMGNDDKSAKNIMFFVYVSLILSLAVYGLIYFLNDMSLFSYLLGSGWKNIHEIINVSLIRYAIEFFAYPFIGIFLILHKQSTLVAIKILLISFLAVLLTVTEFDSFIRMIQTINLCMGLFYVFLIFVSFVYLRKLTNTSPQKV